MSCMEYVLHRQLNILPPNVLIILNVYTANEINSVHKTKYV